MFGNWRPKFVTTHSVHFTLLYMSLLWVLDTLVWYYWPLLKLCTDETELWNQFDARKGQELTAAFTDHRERFGGLTVAGTLPHGLIKRSITQLMMPKITLNQGWKKQHYGTPWKTNLNLAVCSWASFSRWASLRAFLVFVFVSSMTAAVWDAK